MSSWLLVPFCWKVSLATALTFLCPWELAAQSEAAQVQSFRDQFRADRWEARYAAVKELSASDLPDSLKIQLALELLAIERRYIEERNSSGGHVDEGYSEPYYTSLTVLAVKVFDRVPSQQEFEELAQAAFTIGSVWSKRLASHGQRYMQVLERLSYAPNQYTRINAVGVAIMAVTDQAESDPIRRRAMAIAARTLADNGPEVRGATMFVLSTVPGNDTVALLKGARAAILNGQVKRDRAELHRIEAALRKLGQ